MGWAVRSVARSTLVTRSATRVAQGHQYQQLPPPSAATRMWSFSAAAPGSGFWANRLVGRPGGSSRLVIQPRPASSRRSQVLPSGVGAHAGLDGHFVIASFDGPPDVVYLNNTLAGQVVERAGDVARVALLYDILKAEALSPRASIDLARKAIEEWT